jgi:pimeloyl-ACP methyl ester carboxylesterase
MASLNHQPAHVGRYQALRPILRLVPPPRSPRRFLHLLDGLARLDTRAIIPHIRCPTLIVGGEHDRIVSAELQREMAGLIPDSRLVIYASRGHATSVEHRGYELLTRRFVEEIRD